MTVSALSVAVLGGGASEERDVSLASARAVVAALRAPGGPREVRTIEIEANGRWRPEGAPRAAAVGAGLEEVDVVFLALHGGAGENGELQGLLEQLGLAYTGSRVAASALCMDKELQRVFLAARGLRVAPGRAFARRDWQGRRAELLAELRAVGEGAAGDAGGWVVKPRCNGSSVGVRVLGGPDDLAPAVEHALEFDEHVLVERRVHGTEATCAVLGNHGDAALRTLTPVEIRPHDGRFFDYEEKYSEGGALELCPPETLSAEVQAELRALSERAHRELGCDGYSRSDFIVPADGAPVFLETNTLPGLTPRSLLPLEAAADGLDFPALCRRLVELAVQAHGPSEREFRAP